MTTIELPAPKTDTLTNAPLELVVWQVRHERLTDASPARALAVRDLLADPYPNISQGDVAELVIGPLPMVASQGSSGWQLKSADNLWTVVLIQDFLALESSGYTTWTEFFRRAKDLLGAVTQVSKPALVQRVGLRYVDRIKTMKAARPKEWEGLLETQVLGMASHGQLGPAVSTAQTVSLIELGQAQVILRSSCASDANSPNGYSMVLDTDCFDATAEAFDAERIETVTNELHTIGLQVFQSVLTPSFFEELRG